MCFTERITSRCGALHVKVVGLVAAAAFGSIREVLVRLSASRVFGLALVVRGVGAGDVQLRLGRRGVTRRRQGRGFIMVASWFEIRGV